MFDIEDVITAWNWETMPGSPVPEVPYATLLAAALGRYRTHAAAKSHAAILTTNAQGRVTLDYPTQTNQPAVSAAVVDSVGGTWYQVVVESVSATQAVVRVTKTSAVTVLGISVLAAATTVASGVTVHVVAVER